MKQGCGRDVVLQVLERGRELQAEETLPCGYYSGSGHRRT